MITSNKEHTLTSNRLILKNTLALYVRMLLTMVVSLFTSRVVLNTLGIQDFGIYNIVAGFVSMFGLLNSAMISATQRFLSFEIGKGDGVSLHRTFIMSVNVYIMISIAILLLSETLGLWFVQSKLSIPAERLGAVKWVYQFSILTLLVTMINVPYNALIVAHEKMFFFAVISIFEVSMKLVIVFMLQWFGADKLSLYSVLLFVVTCLVIFIYIYYCRRSFQESRYSLLWDKLIYRSLISFTGWNLWGNVADMTKSQGLNVILNMFYGPIANAAYGIAYQIRNAVQQFVSNLQLAFNPQIIKSYASDEIYHMQILIKRGAKFSFFLLYFVSLPVLLETDAILQIWLKTVPTYSIVFTRLVIINLLIDSISGPLLTAVNATGRVRNYQLIIGSQLIMIFPISYFLLAQGSSPTSVFEVSIIISFIALWGRVWIVKKLIKLSYKDFFTDVILKSVLVGSISMILPSIIHMAIEPPKLRLVLTSLTSLVTVTATTFLIGLSNKERRYILVIVSHKLSNVFKQS